MIGVQIGYYFKSAILLLLILSLVSCSSDPGPDEVDQTAIDEQLIQDFINDNGIVATRHDSGIYYFPLVENPTGNTQQIFGSILSIYYKVNVLNGDTISFVQAIDGLDPVKLKQGVDAVYPVGLDIGLALMRQGETYKFIVPSSLAFGDFSFSTLIPANAILEFEVELVNIENETDQLNNEITLINNYIVDKQLNDTVTNPLNTVITLPSGVFYKRVRAGIDGDTLISGDNISITYAGTLLDDSPFDATSGSDVFNYTFGTGLVISGLDIGLSAMEHGERALLIIPSILAYRESVRIIPDYLGQDFVDRDIIPQYATKVPPYEVLVFDTTLL